MSAPRRTLGLGELIGLGVVHQPAAMLEQLAYGDRLAVIVRRQKRRNLGRCNLDRRLIQVEQPAIGNVKHRRCDERLRARRDPHCMIGGHRATCRRIRLPQRHGQATVRSIDCDTHGRSSRCSRQELLHQRADCIVQPSAHKERRYHHPNTPALGARGAHPASTAQEPADSSTGRSRRAARRVRPIIRLAAVNRAALRPKRDVTLSQRQRLTLVPPNAGSWTVDRGAPAPSGHRLVPTTM
jgi:hypothetical protein